MKLNELLYEDLPLIKFEYHGKNSTIKKPRVIVLDYEYKGKEGTKNYGKRNDVLAWCLNHAKDPKYTKARIQDICKDFDFVNSDKQEIYDAVSVLYPESVFLIRRYIKDGMKKIKEKKGNSWIRRKYV